jgi:glycosyltransferase involved in cell wall biosynthesis
MKIAVFYNIEFSGAKRVVKEHVVGLKKLGNTVDVYTTDKERDIFDPKLEANNIYLYNFSPTKINIPLIGRLKSDFIDTFLNLRQIHKKIAKDIDSRNYDIVLVHTDTFTQAPFVLRYLKTKNVYYCLEPLRNGYEYALRLKNAPFINTVYENLNRFIRKGIDRKNTRSAGSLLTLSLFARERIIAAYDLYPKVSYLGIDQTIFKPARVKKKNQVFFVADKSYIYGYDLAKEAIEIIPKKIRPELKIIAWRKNNSERLSDEELIKEYSQSFVSLSLSRFDTFGLVPLESMACAVPVIALDVAGYRETVRNDVTGFLVDFDPKEIAQKITELINNPIKGKEMGQTGRSWIENNWTWNMQIKRLNELLEEFVRSK